MTESSEKALHQASKSFLRASLQNFLSPWLHFSTGGIAVLALIITLSSGWVFWQLSYRVLINWAKLADLRQEVFLLQRQSQRLEKLETLKQAQGKLFKRFLRQNFDQKINQISLKKILEEGLRKKGFCPPLKFYFETPQLHEASLRLWRIPTRVVVKLSTDDLFYKMVDKIQKDIPGKAKLKSFALKRLLSLSSATLTHLTQSPVIELFEGTIEFDWYCVKQEGKA